MLLRLRIRSDHTENFIMHIDADANNTFSQLQDVIQKEFKYSSQNASFFLADEEWDKLKEIKIINSDTSNSSVPVDFHKNDKKLGDIIKDREDKLIYVFDQYNPILFYIELKEFEMEKTMSVPVVTLKKGISPIETSDKSNEANLKTKEDPEIRIVFDDLGEIEDLYEIYGEMSNTL